MAAASASRSSELPRASPQKEDEKSKQKVQDLRDVLAPPAHRCVMSPDEFRRPTFQNSTPKWGGYAAVLVSGDVSTPRPSSFFHQPQQGSTKSMRLLTTRVRSAQELVHYEGEQGEFKMFPVEALKGREASLPSIHGLYANTAHVERKTCSLEYWLSIFGTTGGTVPSGSRRFPVEIMNGLFVGNSRCLASNAVIEEYSIRHVINAAVDVVSFPLGATDEDDANEKFRSAGVSYIGLPGLQDAASSEILSHLPKACAAIARAREAGEAVLVCSAKGTNRSVCLVMGYLIQSGLAGSIRQAATVIREVHPSARVSRRFIYDLDQFMVDLASQVSEDDEDVVVYSEAGTLFVATDETAAPDNVNPHSRTEATRDSVLPGPTGAVIEQKSDNNEQKHVLTADVVNDPTETLPDAATVTLEPLAMLEIEPLERVL